MIFVDYDPDATSFGLMEPAFDLAVEKSEIDWSCARVVFNDEGFRHWLRAGYYDRLV